MSNILLKGINLHRTYSEGTIQTSVLKGVNIEIEDGKLTAVIGKSGSGKSTLLHILATLDTPDKGQILFEGEDLTCLKPSQKATFRNKKLGFVYQFHHLLNDLSALENVMLPLLIGDIKESLAKERAFNLLKRVGLEDRVNYKPSELSGGQRQRVAIARALVNQPKLLLADEPTGNLDAENSQKVFELFLQLVKEEQVAVVIVTHDLGIASRSDKIYTIENGVLGDFNDLKS